MTELADIGELPPGWISWEIEPIEPGGRRKADEVLAGSVNALSRVVSRHVLRQEAGSSRRKRGLTSSVRGGFGLINRRDYSFLDSFAEDCHVKYAAITGLGMAADAHGPEEVRNTLEENWEPFESITQLPRVIIDAGGPQFAAGVEVIWVGKSSGLEIREFYWYVWCLENNEVDRVLVTTDRNEAFAFYAERIA